MSKKVVVRVAARGYVDGRYIGEEKEVIEAVDPSGRGKKSRGKSSSKNNKNDNIGNSADNRGNRVGGRGKRGAATGVAGQAKRKPRAAGVGGRDGNVLPGAGAATSARPPRAPRVQGEGKRRGGGRGAGAAGVVGNHRGSPGDAPRYPQGNSNTTGNVNPRARRGRGGKKTPFRTGAGIALAAGNMQGSRALISEVAEIRRWGDEAKSGQFAEALAKEETVKRERLHKVLAQSGHGSRRDMEIMITSGRVMVNGIVATVGTSVSASDAVMVDRNLVKLKFDEALPRIMLYHKPDGEIVTTNDPGNRITVFDNLPRVENGKWMSVGRLDINTSGLLIFTTSGELANRLMHPRYEVEREYAVRVLGELTEEQTQRLLEGVAIANDADADRDNDNEEDEPADARPAKFDSIDKRGGEGTNQWYHVVLREGRNREVRKMFEAVGLTVSRLMRVRFGKIGLPPRLTRGQMVEFDAPQVRAVLKWVGMEVEGHIGALPSADTQNRGRRGAGGVGGAGEAVEGSGVPSPGEKGRGRRGRGQNPPREAKAMSAAEGDADNEGLVVGAAAMSEYQAMLAAAHGADPQAANAIATDQPHTPRKGRRRDARRGKPTRAFGQALPTNQVRHDQVAGESGNPSAISDDHGNRLVENARDDHGESPEDSIGNRLVSAGGGNANHVNHATPSRHARSDGGRGRKHGGDTGQGKGQGQGQNQPRAGFDGAPAAQPQGARRHPRGHRKPRTDSDSSGNR